jgi:YVTN family beta-propeller protein
VSPPVAATTIRVTAVFPVGTLTALRQGLRTLAAIDPVDLSVTDLQKLVITLNGQTVPTDRLHFEPPTTNDHGQVVVIITISGHTPSPSDRMEISLPSGKLTLIATSGSVVIDLASTALALLTDKLAETGKTGLTVPPTAADRLAARLASAYLASSPQDPLLSRELRYAVTTLANAITQGLSAAELANLNLYEPATGGGGGVRALPVTAVAPTSGAGNTVITITGNHFTAGATVTVGGVAATGVVVNGPTSITATVPLGMPSSGAKDVVVRSDGYAPGTLAGGFTVTPYVLASVAVGNNPADVAANPTTNRVYVSNRSANTVSVFDATTNAIIGTPIPVATAPGQLVVNPATNRIYVTCEASNTVTVIDGAGTDNGGAGSIIGSAIAVGASPQEIAINLTTNRIYVANTNADTVTVIDGAGVGNGGAGSVIGATIPVSDGPRGIAVNPVTNRIYVAGNIDGKITVINGAGTDHGGAGSLIGTAITLPSTAYGLEVNPTTNRIYVARFGADVVSVIDGAGADNSGAGSIIGTAIAVGDGPRMVTVDPATNRVYVNNQNGNTVSTIDGAGADNGGAGTVIAPALATGTQPIGITLMTGTLTRLYVTNATTNNVTVIVP